VAVKLYIVHGSHPCACVEKALQMKGIDYRIVELPPPMHAPFMRMRFGARTVPGLMLDDGEKISGSRTILRRLETMQPEPALFPADPEQRAKVEEAERWGDEELQPVARRLIWPAMKRSPKAIVSYSEHSALPLPAPVLRANAPLVTRLAGRLNRATSQTVVEDLDNLPGQLDRVDGYIADGVIGGDKPNAADLQIASTLRLLLTLEDLAPFFDGRPAKDLALRLFPHCDGQMPAGSLSADALAAALTPAATASASA
jgi:glutathione S-transferase